jgi:hypothetical protein
VQEEEQRRAAEEVDNDERRERPEGVDVVDTREAARPVQRVAGPEVVVEHRRHRQARVREPGEGGQDEEPDEDPDGQKGADPDHERDQEGARCRPPAQDQHAGADVAEREERRSEEQQRPLRIAATADGDLVEDRDDKPEGNAREEAAPVEPDRVGDELTDGAIGRRDLVWSGGHA